MNYSIFLCSVFVIYFEVYRLFKDNFERIRDLLCMVKNTSI